MAEVGLLSVSKGPQLDFIKAHQACHCIRKEDRDYQASVWWFPYVSFSSDMLDITNRVITTGKRTASDLQVKQWVRVVSVIFKPGNRET